MTLTSESRCTSSATTSIILALRSCVAVDRGSLVVLGIGVCGRGRRRVLTTRSSESQLAQL